MPTNEERLDVAARLRGIVEKTWYTSWHELYTIKNACGCYDEQDSQDMVLKDRLADLIEPEPERTCTMATDSRNFRTEVVVWFCSECGSPIYNDMKPSYCLYCGAKVVDE